jgi:beta-galactosidase
MKKYPFNNSWLRATGEPPGGPFPDRGVFTKVNLPDDYVIDLPRAEDSPGGAANGYFPQAAGRYVKVFDLPEAWAGQNVLLELDGAGQNTEIFLNGERIGYHPYAYTAYLSDMTNALLPGRNDLIILTQSRQPSTRWYSGGGIFRQAAIHTGGGAYIKPWGIFITTPAVGADSARVRAEIEIKNTKEAACAQVSGQVFDGDGTLRAEGRIMLPLAAGTEALAALQFDIPMPRLWDLDTPNLYLLRAEVRINSQVMDTAEQIFGIRTIVCSAQNGFTLNGRKIKLRGGCVHHDNGALGARALPAAEERKVRILKESGYNALRSAHNPPSAALLDACDRQGMLVLDESFDCWTEGKTALDYHLYFEDWWERDIAAMVRRDCSHPCVFAYSIGNEINEMGGSANGAVWSQRLADCARRHDPTRPVTAAINDMVSLKLMLAAGGKPPLLPAFDLRRPLDGYLQPGDPDPFREGIDKAAEPLNFLGYNYLFRRFAFDRAAHGDRPVCGLESRADEMYDTWQAVLANSNVLGDFSWTAMDNLGEAGVARLSEVPDAPLDFMGPYPWLACHQGDHDLSGERRPQSFYRKILWGLDKGIHLFTKAPDIAAKPAYAIGWHWEDVLPTWTYATSDIGRMAYATAYTDAEEVAFFLNGRLAGKVPVIRLAAFLMVPYEPGTLTAVALRHGEPAERDTLETTGTPECIRLTADKTALRADLADAAFITIEITDSKGRRVFGSDMELTAEVSGEGTLAGLGSGAPCTNENYGTGRRRTFCGHALAIVRAGGNPGRARLEVRAPGLVGATLSLEIE